VILLLLLDMVIMMMMVSSWMSQLSGDIHRIQNMVVVRHSHVDV